MRQGNDVRAFGPRNVSGRLLSSVVGFGWAAMLATACSNQLGNSGTDGAGGNDGNGLPDANIDAAPPPEACTGTDATGPNVAVVAQATFPNPTLSAISIVWPYSGDANNNATVNVRYRPVAGQWVGAHPLFAVPAGTLSGKTWATRFAGSIVGLAAGTAYEVELAMRDVDGACKIVTQTVQTRAVPAPAANATVKAATPATLASLLSAATPGTIIELGAGTYAGFSVTADGTATAPIVVRAQNGATATVNGDIRLDSRKYVHISGLRINGKIKFNGGLGLAITRNTITTTEDGITTKTRAEDCYIADNVVTGATAWNDAALGVDGNNVGEGIEVDGPGHVVMNNRVVGFRDCISFLEDGAAVDQYSIDVLNNDLQVCADDAVEADFCAHNCRIMNNRITNAFIALSSQPGLGGPTYFVRNAMYNVLLSAFKLQRSSRGDILLHNTVVKRGDGLGVFTDDVFGNLYSRNNLFVAGAGGSYGGYDIGDGDVLDLRALDTATSSLDYDGFSSSKGIVGTVGATRFSSIADLQTKTSEVHAVALAAPGFVAAAPVPASPFPAAQVPDLRLAASSGAVDRGVALPNIAGVHAGAAPDLGAYEQGQALPVYGPRP